MANEATLVVRFSDPVDMTVADGTGIEKGAVCKLTDPLTAVASLNSDDRITNGAKPFAGIIAREKIASDGRTRAALYKDGIFDMTASASAITVGDLVVVSGANLIASARSVNDILSGCVIGKALETAAASEVINVLVGRY